MLGVVFGGCGRAAAPVALVPAARVAPDVSDAPDCPTLASLGALPDDGLDDTAAIRALCSGGCQVRLDAGTYTLVTPPLPRPHPWLFRMPPGGCELVGAGLALTILRAIGDTGGADWTMIQLAAGGHVHELTLDASQMTQSIRNEHTPVLRLDGAGDVTPTLIDHVAIANPVLGGDCLSLVGYPPQSPGGIDRQIWNVTISDSQIGTTALGDCSRSGIAIHSGARGTVIRDNQITARDQAIDGEGSPAWSTIDTLIAGNTFLRGSYTESGADLAPQDWLRLRVTGNQFLGKGIFLYGCRDCEIDHNVITSQSSYVPPLEADKAITGLSIHHNTITMDAAGKAQVLRFAPAGSVTPSDITVADTTLVQRTPQTVVHAMGVVGLVFRHVTLVYDGMPPAPPVVGIYAVGSNGVHGVRTTGIAIEHSTFAGRLSAVLSTGATATDAGVGTVTITDSSSVGAVRGLTCNWPATGAGMLGPVVYARNSMPAAVCDGLVTP